MDLPAEQLEQRIAQLRAEVRKATRAGEPARAIALRAELRAAESAWEQLLTEAEAEAETENEVEADTGTSHKSTSEQQRYPDATTPLLPLREQVHEALSLLAVPATPKLIVTIHEAFFASTFPSSKLTSLKRDEERSFRVAPFARPYYICAALTADRLTPSRGLLAISTWPTERRMIGPLSPRTDFLTSAIKIAEAIDRLPNQNQNQNNALKLLYRFARNIPGAPIHPATLDTRTVIEAAQAELAVHEPQDTKTRHDAARRARNQLDDAEQLFGAARLEQLSKGIAGGTGD